MWNSASGVKKNFVVENFIFSRFSPCKPLFFIHTWWIKRIAAELKITNFVAHVGLTIVADFKILFLILTIWYFFPEIYETVFSVENSCKRCCRTSLNDSCNPVEPLDILPRGTPCIQGFCDEVIYIPFFLLLITHYQLTTFYWTCVTFTRTE